MIILHDVEINAPFRYLWLKYVTGVNLGVHCAQCLKGDYSIQISPDTGKRPEILLDEHPSKVVYLCGVSKPYDWSKNFHLAMREVEGESFEVDQLGIRMTVENAIPLPIEAETMKANAHPKLADKAYSTCRNWQFANWLEVTCLLDAVNQ